VLTWLLLGIAILTEVAATVALKLSDGFTRVAPACVVILGYGASFVLMSKILQRGMNLGVVYAVWSALGISLIVVIDKVWFDNSLTAVQIAGIALIVVGIAALQLGSSTA
jgi:small multidrug resistance pump